jgi:hypothetical protein
MITYCLWLRLTDPGTYITFTENVQVENALETTITCMRFGNQDQPLDRYGAMIRGSVNSDMHELT